MYEKVLKSCKKVVESVKKVEKSCKLTGKEKGRFKKVVVV